MSIFQVRNLSFGDEGRFACVLEKVDFHEDADCKLNFAGHNIHGKTTLLNLLLGDYPY